LGVEAEADEEVVEGGLGGGGFGKRGGVAGSFELGGEALDFGGVEGEVGVWKGGLFGAGEFAGDEVGELGELGVFVKGEEVGLDLAGAHGVDARGEG
jgi:hypothetical protein